MSFINLSRAIQSLKTLAFALGRKYRSQLLLTKKGNHIQIHVTSRLSPQHHQLSNDKKVVRNEPRHHCTSTPTSASSTNHACRRCDSKNAASARQHATASESDTATRTTTSYTAAATPTTIGRTNWRCNSNNASSSRQHHA